MSAALKLTQNHEAEKGTGGEEKDHKGPEETGAKSSALWSGMGAVFYK